MNNVSIRSVTTGIPVKDIADRALKNSFADYTRCFTELFSKNGFSVRTQRICLSPLNHHSGWNIEASKSIVDSAQKLAMLANTRWICVPFDFTDSSVTAAHANIPFQILKQYPNCFVNVLVADDQNINVSGVSAAASLIKKVSKLSMNGFDNFRLGIACNCGPNIPFFPFSYSSDDIGFSFAVETLLTAINVAKNTHNNNDNLGQFKRQFKDLVVRDLRKISEIGLQVENNTGIAFKGVDISFAPFPGESDIVTLIEILGTEIFGGRGTVFLTSILTDLLREILDETNIRVAGFNGVMFSLLEDSGLVKRNDQRMFDIDSLHLYSTVCGCGVDMVPMPGDVLEEEISGLILDTSALAINLKKPLGVRVLPVPNKDVNQYTDFNYDFLINTRIKEIKNAGVHTSFVGQKIAYKNLRG